MKKFLLTRQMKRSLLTRMKIPTMTTIRTVMMMMITITITMVMMTGTSTSEAGVGEEHGSHLISTSAQITTSQMENFPMLITNCILFVHGVRGIWPLLPYNAAELQKNYSLNGAWE